MKNKRIICAVLLLCLLISLCSPFVVSAEESYTLSGEWIFNKEIEFPDESIKQEISFTEKSSSYTHGYLSVENDSISYGDTGVGSVQVYSSSGWEYSSRRFLNFGSTSQSVSKEFYEWFTNNAKQGALKPSDILDDLGKDERFDLEEYPDDPTDYSLDVVQIAESDSLDLYVYVYQPSNDTRDYKAIYINMSVQNPTSKDLNYKLYPLILVDSHGTLDKYKVLNYVVSENEDRYYNIASIYRFFDSEVDDVSEAVDSIQCKGYKVGQYWHTYYYNDELYYEQKEIDVVEVDIKATGSVRYDEGFKLYQDACDSHYVAFSVENYKVDQIFDADITYTLNQYRKISYFTDREDEISLIDTEIHESEYLSSKDTGSNDGDGWLGMKYIWNRIEDVDTFTSDALANCGGSFSDEEYTAVKNAQFVFRFAETTWSKNVGDSYSSTVYSEAERIGILRLHFISEGKYYNLGVVSDLVGTDSTPELELDGIESAEDWWEENGDEVTAIVALIILLLAAILIYIYARDLGVAIIRGIADLLTLLINLLLLPFKLLSSLLKNRDG